MEKSKNIDYTKLKIINVIFGDNFMIVRWCHNNLGIGEVTFSVDKSGKNIIDEENMGFEFVNNILQKIPTFWLSKNSMSQEEIDQLNKQDENGMF